MKTNVIERTLHPDFYKFLNKVDPRGEFTAAQRQIKTHREIRLSSARKGNLPNWPPSSYARSAWKADLPEWMEDQRNQMTGPADNEKLVVQLLNSGSPGVMLDLEDSMANTGERVLAGHRIIKLALAGKAYYYKTSKKGHPIMKRIKRDPKTVVFVRVRGLHLDQVYPTLTKTENRMSASMFDLAYHFFDMDLDSLQHPPCIYIPKTEGASEALWWKKAFERIEKAKGWPLGTIKAMALVESHPIAYEVEEFAYKLQPYLVGLNLGRWDYMASLIDFMYDKTGWIFPDRNEVPPDVPFFQNLRYWMAHVCHKHGMLAIGGMSALYPNRKNKKLNDIAQAKLKADKENEAACLMDGAWTGHPDQNAIAVAAFPEPNQLDKMPQIEMYPDLREFDNKYPVTEEGTREAIRTCIQYRQAVLEGKGAKLINGYMEDLATDRIYRAMIMQRIDRGVHTEQEVWDMFDEECFSLGDKFVKGTEETIKLIDSRQLNPR